jgi:SAM-dependent methyltransferase
LSVDPVPYSGISELADAEQGLFNYYSNIISLVVQKSSVKSFDGSKFRVLEFGAGTGFLSELMQEKYGVEVDCLEIDETLIEILKSKGFRTFSTLEMLTGKYDLIFSSNVLEHIEHDCVVLADLTKYLQQSGQLVTYVPAFPILFSDLDRSVGHYRRYTKRELRKKLRQAGYKINRIQFVDSLGFPASLLLRLLGYKSKGNLGGLTSLRVYDRFFFPISKLLDQLGFRFLFGKNLIVHASLRK